MDKKVIKEATKPVPEPTMGHMYRDIATMTQVDGKTCDKVAVFIFGRLTGSSNPYQIQKSLKVIKYVAANGHSDFQRWYLRKTDELKEYSSYKGATDAVFGTSLNDQIRQAARDAIEACATERIVNKLTKIEGHGGSGGGDPAAGKNDSFKEHVAMPPSVGVGGASGAEKFKQEFNKIHGLEVVQPKVMTGQESQFEQFKMAAKGGFGLFAGSTNHEDLARQMEQDQTGSYGGITLDVEAPMQSGVTPSSSAPFKFLNEGKESSSIVAVVNDASIALNRAQRVVDAFTGLKQIGRSEINKLLREVENVTAEGEAEDLVIRLDEKIQQKVTWTVRCNALTCIESLARAGNPDVLDYFTENPEDIYRNVNVVQSTVKDKAKKCLQALSLPLKRSAAPKATPESAPPPEVQPEPTPLNGEPPKEDKPKRTGGIKKRKSKKAGSMISAPEPVATPQLASDMFAGLSMDAPNPPPQEAFPFFGAQPTVPAPLPAAALTPTPVTYAPPVAPVALPVAPAAPVASNDLDFLFGGPAPAVSAPAVPAPAVPAPVLAQPAGGGSDFFDMLSGGAPQAPVVAQPAAPVLDTFPLGFAAPAPVVQAPVQQTKPVVQAPRAVDPFSDLMMGSAPAPVPTPMPAAPVAPVAAAPQVDVMAQLAAITDPAEQMRMLEQQQALLASQIAALQVQ